MGWPYEFLDLNPAEKHARRLAIDRYAGIAQLSALLPPALFLLYRTAAWAVRSATAARGGSYDAVPNSPSLKVQRQSRRGVWSARTRRLWWWLGDDVFVFGQLWGQRDQWLLALLWGTWLLALCIVGTGRDYLHLTKRFGSVALSQFPILYLMSLKSLNPFVYIFKSSHERVNRLHRALGRLLYSLLILHVAFYVNFLAAVGVLGTRLFAPVVFAGVCAFIALSLLSGTALRAFRRISYRAFFITHLAAALAVPPLLFFHAHPARLFVVEALVVFVADLASRKLLHTTLSEASVEPVPGTDLVRVSAPMSSSKLDSFRAHPGAHVYLSVPAASRPSSNPASPSSLLFEFLYNPFTVAAVDDDTTAVTLVARRMAGPMTGTLGRLAASGTRASSKAPLCLEGPYGAARHFSALAAGRFSRILLVAGGVGATFTVPLYRSLARDNPTSSSSSAKVEMVWAVRSTAETAWAAEGKQNMLADQNVHVFVTGDDSPGSDAGGSDDDDIEMASLTSRRYRPLRGGRRPDLKAIVDDFFSRGAESPVAVVTCGPDGMARELRAHVGAWVRRGRPVWWHNEAFGM